MKKETLTKLQKFLGITFFVVLLFFGSKTFFHPQTAYAYDTEQISTYFQADNIYLDQNGNLIIQWQKIQLGFGGYTLPGGLDGRLAIVAYATSTGGSANVAQIAEAYKGGGQCVAGHDNYAPTSESPYGNTSEFSSIWDGATNTSIPTSNLNLSTPLYVEVMEDNEGGCSPGASAYAFSQEVFLNSIQEPVQPTFLQPYDQAVIGDFAKWTIELSNNTSTEATGTLLIHYGNFGSNNLPLTDSAPYDTVANSDTELQITKSNSMVSPQNQTTTEWWARAEVINTSTAFDFEGPIISFFVNPESPTFAPYPSGMFNFGGETSSTIAGGTTNCPAPTSSFVDDPVGNIQYGICSAFNFLFIPNSAEQTDLYSQFHGSWDQVSTRVPFGYVPIITTAFSNFQEGTNTSTLMSTTTYAALSSVLDPLKTGISFLLILLFAFWLFHFARNITL